MLGEAYVIAGASDDEESCAFIEGRMEVDFVIDVGSNQTDSIE